MGGANLTVDAHLASNMLKRVAHVVLECHAMVSSDGKVKSRFGATKMRVGPGADVIHNLGGAVLHVSPM